MISLINKRFTLALILIMAHSPIFAMDSRQTRLPNVRRRLIFEDNQPTTANTTPTAPEIITEPEYMEPSTKRRKLNDFTAQPVETSNAKDVTFSTPDILANIARSLPGPDLCRFARVSKSCNQATMLDSLREQVIANELSQKKASPIHYVLRQAQTQEALTLCGLHCHAAPVIKYLQEKGSLLREAFDSVDNAIIQKNEDIQQIPLPQSLNNFFQPAEIAKLQAVKYVAITAEQETEELVIERIKQICNEHPNHAIALDLAPPDNNPYQGEITESFIKKLAPYPIVSLNCDEQTFPNGLACLTNLKQLRQLFLTGCTFADPSITDEFCLGLPLLNVLVINGSAINDDSDLTTVSPKIDALKNLVVLDLNENQIAHFPTTLKNLRHLQFLGLAQIFPSAPAELRQCLPPTDQLRELALAYADEANPLPEPCSLANLENLTLDGNLSPLQEHSTQLENLKQLTLYSDTINELPPYAITAVSEKISGLLNPTTKISYDSLLLLTRHVTNCTMFSTNISNMENVQKLANLWQCIYVNNQLIKKELAILDPIFKTQYRIEITLINWLMKNTIITAEIVRKLIENDAQRVNACDWFIQNKLLALHPIVSGLFETSKITKKYQLHDETFATAIITIASNTCHDIPVHRIEDSGSQRICRNSIVYNFLKSVVTKMNQIINHIKNGNVITDEQFNSCITLLKGAIHTNERLAECCIALANLFFHHAITNNDITNAAIILKHNANINFAPYPAQDTLLHKAIRNRFNETNTTIQKQIDHVICFLVQNGAALDKKNSRGETPLDLIPANSPLRKQIYGWVPQAIEAIDTI